MPGMAGGALRCAVASARARFRLPPVLASSCSALGRGRTRAGAAHALPGLVPVLARALRRMPTQGNRSPGASQASQLSLAFQGSQTPQTSQSSQTSQAPKAPQANLSSFESPQSSSPGPHGNTTQTGLLPALPVPTAPSPQIQVLYEDSAILAISKPAGIMVHSSREAPRWEREQGRFVKDIVERERGDCGGHGLLPVHRLDRGASGVLLFAKSSASAAAAQRALATPTSLKLYTVLCRGRPPAQFVCDEPIKDGRGIPKAAVTHCTRVQHFPHSRCSLLLVRISTGRHHQIRRHLNYRGFHVIGDSVHGKGRDNRHFRDQHSLPPSRLFLHASLLALAAAPLGHTMASAAFGAPPRPHAGAPLSDSVLTATVAPHPVPASARGAVLESEGGGGEWARFSSGSQVADPDPGLEDCCGRGLLSRSQNGVVCVLAGAGLGGWRVLLSAAGVPSKDLSHGGANLPANGVPLEHLPDGGASANPVLPIFAPLPDDLCLVLSSVCKAESLKTV